MKELMKIVGVKIVKTHADAKQAIVELTLLPKQAVKPKDASIFDLANGDIGLLQETIMQNQQFETKLYVTNEFWLKVLKNQMFSDVWLDITVSRLANEIAGGR